LQDNQQPAACLRGVGFDPAAFNDEVPRCAPVRVCARDASYVMKCTAACAKRGLYEFMNIKLMRLTARN